MKKILYTFFLLGGLMLFANISFAQTGTYTLSATDSFGDGWNGAAIEITTPAGTVVYNGPPADPAAPISTTEILTFDLMDGDQFTICETLPGTFANEIDYNVVGPDGSTLILVANGDFLGDGGCFSFTAQVAPAVCAAEQCAVDVTTTLLHIDGLDFGDGWAGSTLEVTVNGEVNPVNTITGDGALGNPAPVVHTYNQFCLEIGETNVIGIDFVYDADFDDDHIAWEVAINSSGGILIDDPMNLLVRNDPTGPTNGLGSMSGDVTITCPIPTPTPNPNVTCGIFEVGKSDFIQAPGAVAECSNGFNCEETLGGDAMVVDCPDATIFENGATVATVMTSAGGGLNPGTFPSFTVPANANPAAVLEGISYTLCATGDFDTAGEGVQFFANGVSIGSIAGTGLQCSTETCMTFADCGTNAVGDIITFTTTDTGANSGFCDAQVNVTPNFQYSGEAVVSTEAFACITWYTDAVGGDPIFIGQDLPFSIIQGLIASGDLPESVLCHEQISTLFVTTRCGEATESERFPVNLFTFNPCPEGSCAHYLELTDAGADGWEGASLTVSVNEGADQEFKLTASDGACTVSQFCLSDGETLDLQYWEGADNFEHGYNVIGPLSEVLLTEGPGPSTEENRITASCPIVPCLGTTVDATIRITLGGAPEDFSFEIYDGFNNPGCQGSLVTGQPANTFAGLAAGTQVTFPFTIDLCNQFTLNLFDGGVDGLGGAVIELITPNLDYGVQITNPMDPFFGQSVFQTVTTIATPGFGSTPFTLACSPACVDTFSFVTLGDCFADATVLPIAAPVTCFPDCNNSIGCDIQFRHTILNDGNDNNIAFQSMFMDINGQESFDHTADSGFQMSAGCHSYVTEYLYCDGITVKCTSQYTVVPQETSSFACNDNVTIPLRAPDANPLNGGAAGSFSDDLGECVVLVTADLLIEGGVGSPVNINCEFFNINDFYEVVILDANDQPLVVLGGDGLPLDSNGSQISAAASTIPANNFVGPDQVKQTLKYVITHKVTGTTCWGELTVEDKIAPTITTTDYEVSCNDPNLLDEFFSETITLQSSAADELPANIPGGNAANPTNTFVPFTVPCGALGTLITDVTVTVGIDHSDTPDLDIFLNIPTAFNATLATPFPDAVLQLNDNNVTQGTNVFTPNPNGNSANLLGLLGADCKEAASEKDVDFISETVGDVAPQGLGKTWYINVRDNSDVEGTTPPGGGEVLSATISITCGFPFPFLAFDCTAVSTNLISEVLDESCDNPAVIRVWQAEDACGNTSNSTQTVTIVRPTISDLDLPMEEVFIECGTEMLDANGDIDPAQSGAPEFCCDEVTDEDLCRLSLSFEDDILPSCGNSFKVLRTWQILNWCSASNTPTELTQLIVVGDSTPPAIDASAFTISADANCEGNISLSDLAITDVCSAITAVRLEITTGSIYTGTNATNIFDLLAGDMVTGLPLGSNDATIIATDECGNSTNLDVVLNVVDDAIPTAICDDELNISLNSNGTARLFATDFDEGSNDNCSDVTVEIQSLGSVGGGFGEFADFSCADLGTVRVELLVTDAAGNTNLCWADLLVEDPIGPSIVCKDNVTITCDELLHAEDAFSAPEATDNCGVSIEAGDIISTPLPMCGELLTQTFTATDGSDKSDDASCTQTVTVVHVSDFIVQFPSDVTITDCTTLDDANNSPLIGEPILTEVDCENIGISIEDRIFTQVEDACFKIERTYTIVNHCIVEDPSLAGFTALGTPLPVPNTFRDDDGFFQFTQIIKVQDDTAPTIEFTAPDPCDFTPGCFGPLELIATGDDNCSPNAVTFTYQIDVDGDGTFEIEGEGADASQAAVPYGDHIIKFSATDGCGNFTAEEFSFSLEDCKNPTPFCQGLTTIVMNNADDVTVTAASLLEDGDDNCTVRTAEEWKENARVRREGSGDPLTADFAIGCADVTAGGAVNVEVWIEDEAGNADFCVVAIVIQDNIGVCPTGGTGSSFVSGVTATEVGNSVDDVEVAINNDLTMTNADGIYSSAQPTDEMVNVTPEKLDGVAEGVSTFDLVLLAQHVLQINELTTPYQFIAADVTGDEKIDIRDLVELRQLILFSITEFSNNTSWRFVDADYTFQNPTAPLTEDYPQSIDLMNTGANDNEDFVAVKIGDLDGTAKRPFTNGVAQERTTSTLTMVIDDVEMSAGNDYKVDFRASDFNEVTGYQFTLNFDQNAADFVSVEAGALKVNESNFGFTMINEGIITTSFTEMGKAISVENDEVLFSINFSATANATLTDVISLTNEYTVAEAYNNESEVADVRLAFNNAGIVTTAGGEFELFQNRPNPFNDFTTVGFNLPEATSVTLRIYDVSGKTLKVIATDAARGYNEVNVNRNELGAAGVLYYQLDTDTDSAVKKMIILN